MKQKRCYEENTCGYCNKVMDGDRRGLWKYYCNMKCMDGAMKNFREAFQELCKCTHVCVVKMGIKE